ncbi:hypothetical protein DIPPA_59180 [Diplonema papillatum]|nr:hypothetical protein DIPPA_59180 [Diplonema papillatum]
MSADTLERAEKDEIADSTRVSAVRETPLCVLCNLEVAASGMHIPSVLPCGHYYGRSCLMGHFVDQKRRKCAACDSVFHRTEARTIFIEDPAVLMPSQQHVKLADDLRKMEASIEETKETVTTQCQQGKARLKMLRSQEASLLSTKLKVNPARYRPYDVESHIIPQLSKAGSLSLPDGGYTKLHVSADGLSAVLCGGSAAKVIGINLGTLSICDELSAKARLARVNNSYVTLLLCDSDASDSDQQLLLWDARISSAATSFVKLDKQPHVTALEWGIDQTSVFVGTASGSIQCFDTRKCQMLYSVSAPGEVSHLLAQTDSSVFCTIGSTPHLLRPDKNLEQILMTVSANNGIAAVSSGSFAMKMVSGTSVDQLCVFKRSLSATALVGCVPVFRERSVDGLCDTLERPPCHVALYDFPGDPMNTAWAVAEDDVFVGTTSRPEQVQHLARRRQAVNALSWCGQQPSLSVLSHSHLAVFSANIVV